MTRWQKVLGIFAMGGSLHLGLTCFLLAGGCEPSAMAADTVTSVPMHSADGGLPLPVGDLSWPAVLLALGYMLRGWSPSLTVHLKTDDK